jgi:hypothetical protein
MLFPFSAKVMPEVKSGKMSRIPSLCYDPVLEPRNVRAALVWGLDLPSCPRIIGVPGFLSEILERVRAEGEGFFPAERKAAVRSMIRFGKFRPAGRSKPSNEYLLSAALKGEFPIVNGPVDVNNAVSLEWGYPASIFAIELCGPELLLQRGLAGECYTFNSSGQTIALEDLICVCRKEAKIWLPCGNPVKDSMSTKVRESTRGVAGVIYAPRLEPRRRLESAAARFTALLETECGAAESGWSVAQTGASSV